MNMRSAIVIAAFLVFLSLCALLAFKAEKRRGVFSSFFGEKGSPYTLAFVRAIVFGMLFYFTPSLETIRFFSGLPKELQFPPLLWGPLLRHLPISPEIATPLWYIFAVACLFGVLGLFTRASAIVAVVVGLYVLGIPQFYGKVNHYHHLLWFAAIMTVSRCSDVLSLDAIRSAWKRADAGTTTPPEDSVVYGLPVRVIWLLIGVVYFFPGMAKLVVGNFDWLSGNGLAVKLAEKWNKLGWRFPIAMEKQRILLALAAMGTIVFEVGFAILLLSRRWRWSAVAMGFVFHNLTALMMRISFIALQASYLTFINWSRVFQWLGSRLFAQRFVLVYDGACKICRRTVGTLRAFDVFDQIDWIASTETDRLRAAGLNDIADAGWLEDFTGVLNGERHLGYDAYRQIAKRIPLLWPVAPFMRLPGVSHTGRAIYAKVAASRLCDFRKASAPTPSFRPVQSIRALTSVSAVLIGGNLLLGTSLRSASWPFACYPTFVGLKPSSQVTHLNSEVVTSGVVKNFEYDRKAMLKFGTERWDGLLRNIAEQPEGPRKDRQLRALWEGYSALDQRAVNVDEVRVYADTLDIDPFTLKYRLISRKELARFKPAQAPSTTMVSR